LPPDAAKSSPMFRTVSEARPVSTSPACNFHFQYIKSLGPEPDICIFRRTELSFRFGSIDLEPKKSLHPFRLPG
jgi:hypothetical protein